MSPEEIETHLKVKAAINTAICILDEEFDLGEFFPDGTLVSNDNAGLSTEPDGTFVKWHSYKSGKVRLKPRKDKPGHFMEVIGRPDWVMEILSRWTVAKDTKEMAALYHAARIPEYWLIDAQEEEMSFKILTYRRGGYVEVPPRDGWHKSRVFGCYVRLERQRNRMGRWRYKLHVKPA
jgi:Uma2 family endonuclease